MNYKKMARNIGYRSWIDVGDMFQYGVVYLKKEIPVFLVVLHDLLQTSLALY